VNVGPTLFYPANEDAEKLHKVTLLLYDRFRWAVNDNEETLSILNYSLGLAMVDFKEKGGMSLPSYYRLIAQRRLINAVRSRNCASRIKQTQCIDLLPSREIDAYHQYRDSFREQLDLGYLSATERTLIEHYYIKGETIKEISKKTRIPYGKVSEAVVKTVLSIRANLRAKGEKLTCEEDNILIPISKRR